MWLLPTPSNAEDPKETWTIFGKRIRTNVIRIEEREIQRLWKTIGNFSALDDQMGSGQLWKLALLQLRLVEATLNDSALDSKSSIKLQSVAGELRRSIGWLSFDAGKVQQARNYLNEALNFGYATADYTLISRIVSNMTRLTIDQRLGRETVELAENGSQYCAKYVTARIRALLALREAQGWALRGDKSSCDKALSRAHQEFERGPSELDPNWAPAYISDEQLALYEATCRADLAQNKRADKLFHEAAKKLNVPGFRRDLSICLARRAHNALRMNELEQAATHTQHAAALARNLTSTRVTSEIRQLVLELLPHQKNAVVSSVLDRLKSYASPLPQEA